MKSVLSQKDLQLIKKTFLKITESYYQNPKNQLVCEDLSNICEIITQVISLKDQSRVLSLLTALQTLKIKVKQTPKLISCTQKTINHLKSPAQKEMNFETVIHCLQKQSTYTLICTLLLRFHSVIHRNFDWKSIITQIGSNSSTNPTLSIQLLNVLCLNNQTHCRQTAKSGFLKYLFSPYLSSIITQKLLLYRTLKLLKVIAPVQPTILKDRQRILASVLFKYEDYFPVIEGILSKCYNTSYKIDSTINEESIDVLYLWSHYSLFCQSNLTPQIITSVSRVKSMFTPSIQTKAYAIFANYSKYNKQISINQVQLPKYQSSLQQYLKFCLNCVQNDHKEINKIDFQRILKMSEKGNSVKQKNLYKKLTDMRQKGNKVGLLPDVWKKMFINQESLIEKAKKIPQNNDELQQLTQIIVHPQKLDQFQTDLLLSAKQKCFASIRTAILQSKVIDLNILLKRTQLKSVKQIVRVLQLLQLQLTMNENTIQSIDEKRVFELIKWVQENYNGEVVDWGSLGELIFLFKGEDQWKNHLKLLPKQSFWLLSIDQLNQLDQAMLFKTISLILNSKEQNQKHFFMIGILGKVLESKQKQKILQLFPQVINQMFTNIRNNINFKTTTMLLSLFFNNWHTPQQQDSIFKQFLTPIASYMIQNLSFHDEQYNMLQSILPHPFPTSKLSEQVSKISTSFGKLAKYIYSQNPRGLSHLFQCNTGTEIIECLTFLEGASELIQPDELSQLAAMCLYKKEIYWHLYPHFINILKKIISIASNTPNQHVNPGIVLERIMEAVIQNEDMVQDQQEEIYQQIKEGIERMKKQKKYIDVEKVKKLVNKIKINVIREKIIVVLNQYPVVEQKLQKPFQKKYQEENISRPVHQKQQQQKHYSQIIVKKQSIQVIQRNYISHNLSNVNLSPQILVDAQQKNVFQQSKEDIKEQLSKILRPQDQLLNIKETIQFMDLLKALKRLKTIVETKTGAEQFPKLLQVFERSLFQKIHKQILGHLLIKLYPLRADPRVLGLLLQKEKTLLSRQGCYELLSQYRQAFLLAQRWRLTGREWMDLAMMRVTEGFFADGCQVIEYNLVKSGDTEYYHAKGYAKIISEILHKASTLDDRIYYLLLIGTSARLPHVKALYISKKLHIELLQCVVRHPQNLKVIANCSYALSSLVYMQPEICLDIVKQKNQITKMHQGYRMHCQSRPVVESGACLIANLAYSNDEVKEVMRQQGIIDLLLYLLQSNIQKGELSTFKQILRAFGNLTLSKKCSTQIIDKQFCSLARKVAERINIVAEYNENKARIMKVLIDLIANLTAHKYKLQAIHAENITLLMLTLLQTTQSNAFILSGCIDAIDGLCQCPPIQHYVVSERKLPFVLIDILKIQEDQKIILKATRLLTNLTINPVSITLILKANLLSVLANIVMPALSRATPQQTKKMEAYVFKILTRIFNSKQSLDLILKSGYLDCLVRALQHTDIYSDAFIDILSFYTQHLPTFLNKRAFVCLIRVLTDKHHQQIIVQKCLCIFKVLLTFSIDKDQEDLIIEGVPNMYLQLFREHRDDTLLLLGYHCLRSFKLRELMRRQTQILNILQTLTQKEDTQQCARFDLFVIFNTEGHMLISYDTPSDDLHKAVKKGFPCKLFRTDGSSKKAFIALDDEYNFIAWKQPSGEVKPKYKANVRQIRDFQFCFEAGSKQWSLSPFTQAKGIFGSNNANPAHCCSIIGSSKWGEIAFINVEFDDLKDKEIFYQAFSSTLVAFKA